MTKKVLGHERRIQFREDKIKDNWTFPHVNMFYLFLVSLLAVSSEKAMELYWMNDMGTRSSQELELLAFQQTNGHYLSH